jgi:DNA-binding LacI/PurR family transcriptional regulator
MARGEDSGARPATITDVARAAGVSIATVSRAIRQPDIVSERTRRRVLAAVSEVGYMHNPAARALATGRNELLGLTVPSLTNPFLTPIISGAQQAAEENGYDLVIVVDAADPQRQATLMARLRGRVAGLVAVAPRGRSGLLSQQARAQPVATVNRKVPGVSSVVIDTNEGLRCLGRHLTGLGHRRIAYVGGPEGSRTDRDRLGALEEVVREADGEVAALPITEPTFAAGTVSADGVARSGCSAVIVYNSVVTVGLVHQLRAMGIGVPEDLSVACADDLTDAGLSFPHLTALHIPAHEAGRRAASMVLERLELRSPSAGPQRAEHALLPVELLPGTSTARAGEAAEGAGGGRAGGAAGRASDAAGRAAGSDGQPAVPRILTTSASGTWEKSS